MSRGVIQICYQLVDVSKIFLIVSVICFAPQLLFLEKKNPVQMVVCESNTNDFKLGIESITSAYITRLCGHETPCIGLVSHYAAQEHSKNIAFLKQKNIAISKVFYPYYGIYQHDIQLDNSVQEEQAMLTYMIKKEGFDTDLLQDVNLLLVDMQDIGLGYASCVSLLFQTLIAAVSHKIPVVILDRPNVLGNKIEGSLLQLSALHGSIPFRYGMTLGELAYYYNTQVLDKAVELCVIPMQNYHRVATETGPFDSPLLPCVTTLAAVRGFSVCGILAQISSFDVGLNTPYAYQCVALPRSAKFPEQRWYQLQIILRHAGIESSLYSYFSQQKNEGCRGLRIEVGDMHKVDTFNILLRLLDFFKRSGVILGFSDLFDQSVGTPMVREYVQGKLARHFLVHMINEGLEGFYRKAFGSFMYYPLPQIVLI